MSTSLVECSIMKLRNYSSHQPRFIELNTELKAPLPTGCFTLNRDLQPFFLKNFTI